MYDSFDAFEYIDYLRRRWRVIAAACAAALVLSFSFSFLLPKRYTATASIIIEPPGGDDVRYGTAVSAVYLESLKTYESFAESDSLFARAAQQYHLLDSAHPQPIESLKRRVLKVTMPRDTKIMEVSVTLADPKAAQQVAQFIADQTVATNRGGNRASDDAFVQQAEHQLTDANKRLENDQKAWAALSTKEPVGALQAEIDSAVQFEAKVKQELVDAQADIAEYQQTGGQFAHEQLQAAQSRAALLEKQVQDLDREVQQKSTTLAGREAERDALQSELDVARSAYESDTSRVRQLRAAAGSHTEQLRVIDPGIVPQQPSYPNIPLNVVAALLVALMGSLVYLSASFAYRRRRLEFEPAAARGMRA